MSLTTCCNYTAIFFFKNISMSTFSGSSWDLRALTMSPAVEKMCSLETEVAGTERHTLASETAKDIGSSVP